MANESTYKGKIEDWDRLQERLTANAAELAHLEGMRKRLGEVTEQARQMAAEQAAQRAAKQQASQTLKSAVIEGDRLANVLRAALKQHYGIRSEKLAEFGVKPFRGRIRAAKPEPTPPPTSTPPPTPHPQPSGASAGQTPASHPAAAPENPAQ
jgi:hypothetical protein